MSEGASAVRQVKVVARLAAALMLVLVATRITPAKWPGLSAINSPHIGNKGYSPSHHQGMKLVGKLAQRAQNRQRQPSAGPQRQSAPLFWCAFLSFWMR